VTETMNAPAAQIDPQVIDPIDIVTEQMTEEEQAEQDAFEASFGSTSGQLAAAAAAEKPVADAEAQAAAAQAVAAEPGGGGEQPGGAAAAPAAAAAQAPAAAQQADAGGAIVDPFAGMPQAAREILSRIPQLEAELLQTRRVANLVPALQSQIDRLTSGRPAAEGSRTAPRRDDPAPRSARRSLPSIDAIRAEVPEVAAAFDEVIERAGLLKPSAEPTGRTSTDTAPAGNAGPADENEAVLDSVRPNWANDLSSTDFQLWLATQPADYRANVMSTSRASVMLQAFTAFDAARPKPAGSPAPAPQPRNTRMASAVALSAGNRPAPSSRSQAGSEDPEEAAFVSRFNELTAPARRA
jgi:hypothetical protein